MLRTPLSSGIRTLLFVSALLTAGAASAAPIRFDFTTGTVTITIQQVSTGIQAVGPTELALDGTQVTIDPDPAVLTLVSAEMTTTGPWPIPLDPAVSGGYDLLVIEFAVGTAANGTLTPLVPPEVYGYSVGPVEVLTIISANPVDPSNPLTPPIVDMVQPITNDSASGTLFCNPECIGAIGVELVMDGITLGALTSPLSGETIVVQGDFLFEGAVIPEPGTAALLGLGVALTAGIVRRRAGGRLRLHRR